MECRGGPCFPGGQILMTEPIRKPSPPNSVPEEDLSLHENFSPAIAENGLIRQLPADEVPENAFAWMDDPSTRLDIVQDLVKIRQAEKAEQSRHKQTEKEPVNVTFPAEKGALSPSSEGTTVEILPHEGENARKAEQRDKKEKTDLIPSSLSPAGEGNGSPFPLEEEDRGQEPRDERENQLFAGGAPTENLPAIPNVTQTLPALPVLDAAGQTTRLGKTRRKKKRKEKTVRRPVADQPNAAMPTIDKAGLASVAEVPPNSPQTPPRPARPKRHRWGWLLALLLVAFLMIIGGVVPVENIPVLRRIAYAMGFSKDATQRISFLRALLAWTDKTLGLNGKLSPWPGGALLADGAAFPAADADVNNPEIAAGLQAQMARASGDTRLIDMRALNDLQRKQGRALDGISGTVLPEPGREEADLAAVLRDDQVTARTEANRDTGEVFFGSDTSAVNRHFQDGFDSSKMLTKIKNPYITDGHPIDWTQRTARQLLNGPGGLGVLNKELQYGAAAWPVGDTEVGDKKPYRDLYHAWITSRMSKYTSNIWLKKSLAGSSFLNAEIPQTASTGLKMGGIFIDSDSLQTDQEGWKQYLEFEEKCRQEMTRGGGKEVSDAVNDFNDLFYSWSGSKAEQNNIRNFGFPTTCEKIKNSTYFETYQNNLKRITNLCKQAKSGYDKLRNTCYLDSFAGQCNDTTFEHTFVNRWNYFKNEVCKEPTDCNTVPEEQKEACNAENEALLALRQTWEGTETTQGEASKTEARLLEAVGGDSPHFPAATRDKNTGAISAENVEDAVEYGLGKNSANFSN